jgi:putative phosphoesterase
MFTGMNAQFVFGNRDRDRTSLRHAMREIGAVSHENWGHFDAGGIHIGWTHGDDPNLLHDLEMSGHFDFVFYGHSHVAGTRRTGSTLMVNPGALQRARVKSFVLLDTTSRAFESIVVE